MTDPKPYTFWRNVQVPHPDETEFSPKGLDEMRRQYASIEYTADLSAGYQSPHDIFVKRAEAEIRYIESLLSSTWPKNRERRRLRRAAIRAGTFHPGQRNFRLPGIKHNIAANASLAGLWLR